ncbi:MAG TPA: XdhC/CoxI family protein [Kofleriaceae bacterium]|jgi:xanthine/CO dehydrogenase XdhC/CoxF family maturation factor
MTSERSIVDAATRLRKQSEPYLVATVVATSGPAYRRPGARMLLTRFRWVAGSVTGGCLEGDVARNAWAETRGDAVKLVTYDASTTIDDDDLRSAFGLGYDGKVEVLIERAGEPALERGRIDALEVAARCFASQKRGAVATVFEGDGDQRLGARIALVGTDVEEETDSTLTGMLRERLIGELEATAQRGITTTRNIETERGSVRVLVEAIAPPPSLFVFGTGHDVVPLTKLAKDLGWAVVVCGKEPRHATRERFAIADDLLSCDLAEIATRIDACDRAIGIVIGHDHDRDRDVLAMLLGTKARFIGVVGPVSRTSRMLAELNRGSDRRIHAAADIGIDAPQEAALALLADVQDTLRAPTFVEVPVQKKPTDERPYAERTSAVFAVAAAL